MNYRDIVADIGYTDDHEDLLYDPLLENSCDDYDPEETEDIEGFDEVTSQLWMQELRPPNYLVHQTY